MELGSFLPLIIFPFVIGFVFFMRANAKKMTSQHEQTNARFRLGEIAPRLGMQVVEGDPQFNLVVTNAGQEFKQEFTRSAKLAGAAYGGRPTELVYAHKVENEHKEYIVASKTIIHTTFGVWIAARTRVNAPPFEIFLRNPAQYMEARPDLQAPEHPIGEPTLDAALIARAVDPSVLRVIAPALALARQLGYVHIRGEGGRVSFHMTQLTAPSMMFHAEALLHLVCSIALCLEGGQVPPMQVPPPA